MDGVGCFFGCCAFSFLGGWLDWMIDFSLVAVFCGPGDCWLGEEVLLVGLVVLWWRYQVCRFSFSLVLVYRG